MRIKSKIQDKLSEIQDLEDSIIVLKGISLDTIDMENAEKLYFEVADEDGDGTDDSLVINKKMGGEWGRTVLDIL